LNIRKNRGVTKFVRPQLRSNYFERLLVIKMGWENSKFSDMVSAIFHKIENRLDE